MSKTYYVPVVQNPTDYFHGKDAANIPGQEYFFFDSKDGAEHALEELKKHDNPASISIGEKGFGPDGKQFVQIPMVYTIYKVTVSFAAEEKIEATMKEYDGIGTAGKGYINPHSIDTVYGTIGADTLHEETLLFGDIEMVPHTYTFGEWEDGERHEYQETYDEPEWVDAPFSVQHERILAELQKRFREAIALKETIDNAPEEQRKIDISDIRQKSLRIILSEDVMKEYIDERADYHRDTKYDAILSRAILRTGQELVTTAGIQNTALISDFLDKAISNIGIKEHRFSLDKLRRIDGYFDFSAYPTRRESICNAFSETLSDVMGTTLDEASISTITSHFDQYLTLEGAPPLDREKLNAFVEAMAEECDLSRKEYDEMMESFFSLEHDTTQKVEDISYIPYEEKIKIAFSEVASVDIEAAMENVRNEIGPLDEQDAPTGNDEQGHEEP